MASDRAIILALRRNSSDAEVFRQPPWSGIWTRVVVDGDAALKAELGPCLRMQPGMAVPQLAGGQVALWVSEIDQLETAITDPSWATIVFEPTLTAMLDALSRKRSVLVARRRLGAGHVLSDEDVATSAGGIGVPDALRSAVVGRALCYDLNEGEPITFGVVVESGADRASSS